MEGAGGNKVEGEGLRDSFRKGVVIPENREENDPFHNHPIK